jgi:hypothetical protein
VIAECEFPFARSNKHVLTYISIFQKSKSKLIRIHSQQIAKGDGTAMILGTRYLAERFDQEGFSERGR